MNKTADAGNGGKTEAQFALLQEQLAAVISERDAAAKELTELKRNASLRNIAEKYSFTDPDYLGFLMMQKQIRHDDPSGVAGFIDSLRRTSPRLFKLDLPSGIPPHQETEKAGSAASPVSAASARRGGGSAEDLIELLRDAPELT